MRIAGIICEYNPFHNGHAHQLAVLREAGYAPVCEIIRHSWIVPKLPRKH